jgi:hypothetical protein
MKIKWILLILLMLFPLALAAMPGEDAAAIRFAADRPAQEATPQPAETPAPRPPSEAGQNMILIVGAASLVLIVLIGLGLHHLLRQRAAKA